jgi:hypothetical protein
MTEDVRPRMSVEELRRTLADLRAMAQAEKEFPRTDVRQVDVSAEDIEAIRDAYRWAALIWESR